MADRNSSKDMMFPLNPRQFCAAFLDVQRNSRGYINDEVNTADSDAAKRLLSPFIPKHQLSDSIPQCHPLGNTMWTFARDCTALPCQSRNQSTGLNPPACRLSSEEDLQATAREAHELSCSRSSVLPHLTLKSVPSISACKVPELNKQQNLEDRESGCIDTAGLNEASNIKTTSDGTDDQNQNTVLSEFSSLNNGGYHFPACGEVSPEAQVDSKFSSAEAVLNFVGNEQSFPQGHQADISRNSTKKTLGTSLGNEKSSHFEQHIEPANFKSETKLSTSCHVQSNLENNVGIDGGDCIESKHNHLFTGNDKCLKKYENNESTEESVAFMLYVNDIKENDDINGQHLCDDFHIKPLSLYKQGDYNRKQISTFLTLNLNLEALTSVLCAENKNSKGVENNSADIYGKIAVLYGFQDVTVSVLESEVIGMYDYISGTVHGLQQEFYCDDESESQDIKFPLPSSAVVDLDLEAFLAHLHQTLIALSPQTADSGKVLKEHSPVAWLLTSPALGVTLDWQVQEKRLKFVQALSTDEVNKEKEPTVSNKDCFSTQWYNLLVVVDEYRFVEKDIPVVEVYELCPNEEIKLVNFELN